MESQAILNFYEGIACVTEIYAMINSIFSEMITIHKPEKWHAYSSLNEAILFFAKTKYRLTKSPLHEESALSDEEKALIIYIENGSLCDFPDKILLLAKEMKSYSSNGKSEGMDPYIAGHCNLDTIDNFDFIDTNIIDKDDLNENLTLNALIQKSIQISKASPRFQLKIKQEEQNYFI